MKMVEEEHKDVFPRLAERLIKFDDVSSVLGKIDSRGTKKNLNNKTKRALLGTRSRAAVRAELSTSRDAHARTFNHFEETYN